MKKTLLSIGLSVLLLSACSNPGGISEDTMAEGKHYVKIGDYVYYLSENFEDFPIWIKNKLVSESDNKEVYKGRNFGEAYIKGIESLGWVQIQNENEGPHQKGTTLNTFEKDGRTIYLYQIPDEEKFVIEEK